MPTQLPSKYFSSHNSLRRLEVGKSTYVVGAKAIYPGPRGVPLIDLDTPTYSVWRISDAASSIHDGIHIKRTRHGLRATVTRKFTMRNRRVPSGENFVELSEMRLSRAFRRSKVLASTQDNAKTSLADSSTSGPTICD